jgi:hypothetical protein
LTALATLIRETHYPIDTDPWGDGDCYACDVSWPCPTVQAMHEDTDVTMYEVRHGAVTVTRYGTVAAACAYVEDAYYGFQDRPVSGPIIALDWRVTPDQTRRLVAVDLDCATGEVDIATGWSVVPAVAPAQYTRPQIPQPDDGMGALRERLNRPA